MEACSMRCIASGARPPDLSLRGGRRPTWQSRGTCRIIGKPSAKSQLPSRDCTPRALPRASRSGRHGPFGASQWHVRRVQRCTRALARLNAPLLGAQGTPLHWRVRSAIVPRNLQPARRSLTAATDAIGACHFNDSLSKSAVPSRDCHVALLLAVTNLWRSSFC